MLCQADAQKHLDEENNTERENGPLFEADVFHMSPPSVIRIKWGPRNI